MKQEVGNGPQRGPGTETIKIFLPGAEKITIQWIWTYSKYSAISVFFSNLCQFCLGL